MIPTHRLDYTAYMDEMDFAVCCPRKAVKLNHSLTGWRPSDPYRAYFFDDCSVVCRTIWCVLWPNGQYIHLQVSGCIRTGVCQSLAPSLQWRHNGVDGVSNQQPHHCLLSRLFGCRSKKTSKLSVAGLCAGNSPGTIEFPAQMASNAENVSIWWRHHEDLCNYHANVVVGQCGEPYCSVLVSDGKKIEISCC